MPTVNVLYFAAVRDRLASPGEALDLPAQLSATDLLARLAARHPHAAELFARSRVALDLEFVNGDLLLRDGSELAVIPPVSGG